MKVLADQLVLITGAGSGIGKLMALLCAKEGSRLILWDLNKENVEKVASEIKAKGGKAWAYQADVSNKDMVYSLADKIKKEIGKVDVLINNAGIVSGRPFLECSDAQVQRSLDVNILAHFWTTKAFLPDMMKTNHGHIVNIASAAGVVGVAGLADYCASKWAVIGFTESLRFEFKKQKLKGVKTTLVCPYYINTGMFEGVKTRFGFILPILKQEYVAKRIVKAIKKNWAELLMPRIVYTVPMMRILPTFLFDLICIILGVSASMDEFKGRGADVQLKKIETKPAAAAKPKGKKR